jgi:hypothetical protein
MSNEFTKICDMCGKRTKAKGIDDTPVNWYNVNELELYWGNPDKTEYSNKLEISDDTDPDFCSKECIMKWFEIQLDKIKTKKYKVK